MSAQPTPNQTFDPITLPSATILAIGAALLDEEFPLHELVANPDSPQSHIQPTEDNTAHIVHFKTPFPNSVSRSHAVITKIELSHPHTGDCAFCAGLRGNSPAPVASVVNDIIPRKYRSVVKAVLFPCFLLLCAEMLQWG